MITQAEPFYLPVAMDQFFDIIRGKHAVVGCVLLSASPFGKKESTWRKAARTFSVFGFRFFLHYAIRLTLLKVFRRKTVADVLKANGVPIITLERSINDKTSLAQIRELSPDLFVSIAGNEIFKSPLLEIAPCLNLHTAPLPRYRGLMPTFWALRFGESETAVSIFLVDEGIDSGPIVVQKRIAIDGMSQAQLIRETKSLGMIAMVEAIDLMSSGSPNLIENDANQASYYSFPTRNDVRAFIAAGAKFY